MATLVTRCCRKTNQLKSMQGFGMQRYPRKIFKPKKHKKVLPWQYLLPGVAEKLISSNLCRGMESKEPIKIFTSPKKSVARCYRKTNPLQSVQGYGKQRTHKIFISPRSRKKVLPWQHLLPVIIIKLISSNPCRGLEC